MGVKSAKRGIIADLALVLALWIALLIGAGVLYAAAEILEAML